MVQHIVSVLPINIMAQAIGFCPDFPIVSALSVDICFVSCLYQRNCSHNRFMLWSSNRHFYCFNNLFLVLPTNWNGSVNRFVS